MVSHSSAPWASYTRGIPSPDRWQLCTPSQIFASTSGCVHFNAASATCRYRDAPEPDLVGYSVTVQATPQDIAKLHRDAEATWTESFVDLIKVHAPRKSSLHTHLQTL